MSGLVQIRKGQGPEKLDRATFGRRFRERFFDPRFDGEREAIARLEEIAWQNYQDSRKAPSTVPAGEGFADPVYPLSTEWLDTKRRLASAQMLHDDASRPAQILVISGSSRNDKTCPGENAKSWRLAKLAEDTLRGEGMEVDLLDLSLLTSEYGKNIHPCKGCVSTAMPLCHWPCSCYPNHSLGQVNDAMADIYERWVLAHGVMIVTPVYWYMASSPLKLMIDRLVCADGGNPDPSSTHGKTPEEAKRIELAGWDYPQHLAGRTFSVIAHGDAAGAQEVRRNIGDWLEENGLLAAGPLANLDRYIGYYEPYATSHAALDADTSLQTEVRVAAQVLARLTLDVRAGEHPRPERGIQRPRPK